VAGSLLEIGCAAGLTTIFLNKYMDHQGIEKKYYTVDTFSGFVSEDIEFEVANRGKKHRLYTHYQVNSKRWFDGTMARNNISRVRSVQADVNKLDLSTFGPLSFVLLDVDLYRPMRKCLPELYELASPGSIIVVDDCNSKDIRWDGSDQAYKEFMGQIGQPAKIIHGKLGIIRKKS
jgi:O-methyltransferase